MCVCKKIEKSLTYLSPRQLTQVLYALCPGDHFRQPKKGLCNKWDGMNQEKGREKNKANEFK